MFERGNIAVAFTGVELSKYAEDGEIDIFCLQKEISLLLKKLIDMHGNFKSNDEIILNCYQTAKELRKAGSVVIRKITVIVACYVRAGSVAFPESQHLFFQTRLF